MILLQNQVCFIIFCIVKQNNTYGKGNKTQTWWLSSGSRQKKKQEGSSKVIRIPTVDAKAVDVFIDIRHATILDRPYSFSNKEVVEVIQEMERMIFKFKERVTQGEFENMEDIPWSYQYERLAQEKDNQGGF